MSLFLANTYISLHVSSYRAIHATMYKVQNGVVYESFKSSLARDYVKFYLPNKFKMVHIIDACWYYFLKYSGFRASAYLLIFCVRSVVFWR